MTPLPARKKLADIAKKEGGPKAIALRLGISENYLNKLINGKRPMTLHLAKCIKVLFGIPMDDWEEEPKLETVKRVATG